MAGCQQGNGPNGECLVLLGAAFAIQIAQGRTVDELNLVSAFLTVVADNLDLIAIQRATQEGQRLTTLPLSTPEVISPTL